MFHQPLKKIKPAEVKPFDQLTAILSAEQLLAAPKYNVLIHDIAKTSEFEPSLFQPLCLQLILDIAYYEQRLPGSTTYYKEQGGLLAYTLTRTHAAMQLFRQHLLPTPHHALSEEQQRWWYTLFSASLLRGIGTLISDYRIDRYSIKGRPLKQWQPLLESIGPVGGLYGFEFKTEDDHALRRRLTLLLAYHIMPQKGFSLIASHPQTLAIWLALLDEDMASAEAFGAILERANTLALQQDFEDQLAQRPTPEKSPRIRTFVDQKPETFIEKEHIMALEFIQWLKRALNDGTFILNKAPVLLVPQGLLLTAEAFKAFAKEHVSYKNWQSIQHSLLSLKLHLTGAANMGIIKHDEGLLTKGTLFLPESFQIKDTHSQNVTSTSAMELALKAHPKQLSAQGTWIMPEVVPTTPTPEPRFPRG